MPITIGIPFYNAERYFEEAIKSIFAQTYQDWELILIDDGSTDGSLEIARAVNDSRVRVISDGCNRKLPYRLNQITSEAKYDFIGRMDADDIISPTRFEKQLAVLEADPKVDLVTTGVCSITNDSIPVGMRCGSPGQALTGRNLLLGQASVVHAAILGRRSWFLRNPYDETAMLMEDYELWLRAFSKNDFNLHVLNEPLYYYREEGNVTKDKMLKAYSNQIFKIREYGYLGYGPLELRALIAKFRCKTMIVRLCSLINRMDLFIRSRNVPIEDERLLKQFFREIEIVSNIELPR